ncbi:sugar kinase [Cucumibacter marinus]|uniref:sugar kinase n=1 Tax=Cucumibacter marinus TaxID=1121252 RepID=UPI00041D14FF|nr:sugar kinase [Cucumibacter marinus]
MSELLSIGECMIELSASDGADYRLGFAGDTLNTTWYLRALLDPADWPTSFLTALGDDIYSDRMIAFFEEAGIQAGDIPRLTGKRPGLYLIHQENNDRRFTYWRDQSAARELAEDPGLLASVLARAGHVYFSGVTLAILPAEARTRLLAGLESVRASGRGVAFDPNYRPVLWSSPVEARAAFERAGAVSEVVLPSFDDEQTLFGDADKSATADRYLGYGADEVVVKSGPGPALVVRGENRVEVAPDTTVEVPVDTTGAGDSFNGGYLASRLNRHEPPEAAKLAHRLAAKVVMHRGALMPMDKARAAVAG